MGILEYQFFQNALCGSLLACIACGIIGTYIVTRRLVFLCGGITHASFGGLGIALYTGVNPLGGALIFAILSALGIEWASTNGKIREDSAIGIVWSIGMAIGALFMSLTPGYTSGDLSSYMFGSIITVTSSDVTAMGILAIFCIIGTMFLWRSIMYTAFDRDFSSSQGIATRTASYALMIVVAIAIVMAIRIMGIVLLLSLFTIPAVAANSLTKSYASISFWAAIIATFSAVVGLVASYNWEIPPGTSIIFTLTIVLFAAKLYIFAKQKLTLDA